MLSSKEISFLGYNFYSSIKLFNELKLKGIYCCGTLRKNRGGPKKYKPYLNTLLKGEGIIMNNGEINYIEFKDNGVVQIISNINSGVVFNNTNKRSQEFYACKKMGMDEIQALLDKEKEDVVHV